MASITKTTRNKHLVRIRIAGYPEISRQFDHLKDAQVFAKKTEADMLRGRFVDLRPAEETTLRTIIDEYIHAETVLKRGAHSETLRLRKIARDRVADYALVNLTPKAARQYRDQRLATISAYTVIRELNTLAEPLAYSVHEEYMRKTLYEVKKRCPLKRRPVMSSPQFSIHMKLRMLWKVPENRLKRQK